MSGVVLRCPNCGTTRATAGECEACHESQVRYQCTNHTPGRWLDAPGCSQCGARFGEPARPPTVPVPAAPAAGAPPTPPVRARAQPPAPAPVSPPTSAAPPRSAYPSARRPEPDDDERPGRRERLPPAAPEEAIEAPRGRLPSWQEMILGAALRARRSSREARREMAPEPEAVPTRRGSGGCLLRLVIVLVLAFLGFSIAPALFGGLLFQLLRGY